MHLDYNVCLFILYNGFSYAIQVRLQVLLKLLMILFHYIIISQYDTEELP